MADITMPQLGETVTEGTITKWFKQVGDTVAEDEPLFEVSTDKVDSEVPSPISGTLTEIKVPEGETVDVGVVLAVIGAAGPGPAPTEPVAEPVVAPPVVATPDRAPEVDDGESRLLSPVVRRLIAEHGLDPSTIASPRIVIGPVPVSVRLLHGFSVLSGTPSAIKATVEELLGPGTACFCTRSEAMSSETSGVPRRDPVMVIVTVVGSPLQSGSGEHVAAASLTFSPSTCSDDPLVLHSLRTNRWSVVSA